MFMGTIKIISKACGERFRSLAFEYGATDYHAPQRCPRVEVGIPCLMSLDYLDY